MIKPWQKITINIFKASLLLLLIVLTAGMLAGILFGDRIKELSIRELNKRLATEVIVNGDISFSVFANFPAATISFREVVLKEVSPAKKDLLTCESISLLFDVWDLLSSNYIMKEVIVENGMLTLSIDGQGNRNFDIFKTADNASAKEFSLKIEQASFSNMLISYHDASTGQHFVFDTYTTVLSGDFSAGKFVMDIESDFMSRKLITGNVNYIPDRAILLNGILDVDLSANRYTIQTASVDIANNRFGISGVIETSTKGNFLDLRFDASGLKVEDLTSLLPAEYASFMKHIKSKGTIRFDGSIKGQQSAKSNPRVAISFELKNGVLSHDKLKEPFESVNLTGAFTNGASNNMNTAVLDLSEFSASFDGHTIQGNINLHNFEKPIVDMRLDGIINLEKIQPLFPEGSVLALKGNVTFRECYFKGPISQLSQPSQMSSMEAGGSFILEEVAIVTDVTHYKNLNGQFDISNNKVVINNLSFTSNESDLRVTGNVNNFIPYFIHSIYDSLPNKQKIGVDIQLKSRSLSWIDLVGNKDVTNTAATTSPGEYYSIPSLFYIVTGSVSGSIDEFRYEKFTASDVHGKILFLGNTIYFNDFGLSAEKGTVAVNGKLDISNMKRNKLELTAKLQHMDIRQLFHEFENFGQTSLTDQHLKGELNTDLALQATWDERKFNKSKLYAIADVSIDNGELNNFEPMMALAKFVKISELKNIRFSKLQNQVEIKNEKIFIPQMMIFTNALNLQLSGSHSFENSIDYKIQLNLLKLLTSKFEKASSGTVESDKSTEGFLNLYLTMTGPADNPLIRYDKSAVKQKIAVDLKKEKTELKKVLEQEFYEQEKDQQEIKDWKAPEKIEYMEFEEDTISETDEEGGPASMTRENQQKELDNFKNIFKPKNPAPK